MVHQFLPFPGACADPFVTKDHDPVLRSSNGQPDIVAGARLGNLAAGAAWVQDVVTN